MRPSGFLRKVPGLSRKGATCAWKSGVGRFLGELCLNAPKERSICHKAAMPPLQPQAGIIVTRSTAHRTEACRSHFTFRGTHAKEFPSMRALRVSSLRRRVSDLRSSVRSCKRSSRWLAQFARECERDALVTTFYPCRHSCRAPDAICAPSGQDEPVFGRGAPSIRTAERMARPRKFTGASTNLQRCKLLWLTALRAQISEAMSRAPCGSTPSSR